MADPTDESFIEKTEVLYNPDEIVRRTVEQCNSFKFTMDTCIDVNGPSMLVISNHPVTNVCIDLKNKGVKIRFIREITKDNIKYCIQLMKIGEIRHLDDIKGNFGVGDKRVYQGSATTIKSEVPPQMIISTVKSFPIKTDHQKDPRLLTTAIDVKTGGGVIFDSYSSESSYLVPTSYPVKTGGERKNEGGNEEIKIAYPGGLTKEHIMASAAIPANVDYAVIDDSNSIRHMYWISIIRGNAFAITPTDQPRAAAGHGFAGACTALHGCVNPPNHG